LRGDEHPDAVGAGMSREMNNKKKTRGLVDPALKAHVETAGTQIVQGCR
jgi:hypothetical protein